MLKTVVTGSGSWGTAPAQVLVDNAREVVLWGKNPKEIDDINLRYQSTRFFPDVTLHGSPKAICDLNVVCDVDLLALSVPTIAAKELCIKIGTLAEKPIITVNTSKRFHPQTNERMSNVIRRSMPKGKLKGVILLVDPGYAEEAILRTLTTICAVPLCEEDACPVQKLFSNGYSRVYRGDDEVGSEIGVALKNVIVVASGVLSDVGYGDNTKATLVMRGPMEMIHYGVALGGRTETLMGPTGIGDLIATCTSVHSRNFQVGYEIGMHNSARYFWENNTKTVEGVRTTKVVYKVVEQRQIDIPTVEEIYRVLYKDKKPQQSARDLTLRDLKHEMK